MDLPLRHRGPLVSVLLAASACATVPGGQAVSDLAPADRQLAEAFCSRDRPSQSAAFMKFDRLVPPADRPAALERLWDAGAQGRAQLRVGVLHYLAISARKSAQCWSEGLERRLTEATSDPNEAVRRGILAALFERFDPKLRGAILRFLDDPSDEIRAAALRQLAAEKWPEAEQVLQGYLQANGADPLRAGSAQEARAGLLRLQSSRAPAKIFAPPAPPPPPPAPQPAQPTPPAERQPAGRSRLGDD
jgi:HEAT repeat protein